jgi:hypothetical protein
VVPSGELDPTGKLLHRSVRLVFQQLALTASALRAKSQETIRHKDWVKYLDIVIRSDDPEDCCLVIECKVEDDLTDRQLKNYGAWLQTYGTTKTLKRLFSLTKRAINPAGISVPHQNLYWRDLCKVLTNGGEPDERVKFVLETFAGFLKENGMAGYELKAIEQSDLGAFQRAQKFWNEVECFLLQFRNIHRDNRTFPALGKPEINDDFAHWCGLYAKDRSYYVGFAMPFEGPPEIFAWIEITLPHPNSKLFAKLPDELRRANEEAEAFRARAEQDKRPARENEVYFAFKKSILDGFNGRPDTLAEWFVNTTMAFREKAGSSFPSILDRCD